MRICLIGPKSSNESLLIKKQSEEMGFDCKRIFLNDVYFEVHDSKFEAYHRKLDLLDYDVFVFRSIKKFFNEAILLAEFLKENKKIVIDQSLATERIIASKLYKKYLLSKNNILQVDSVVSNGLKAARDVLMDLEHPILIKSYDEADKPKVTYSEDWTESYDLARTNKNKHLLYIKSIPVDCYIRVFVIGDKIIGGFKRVINEKEPKLNFSKKYKTEYLEISEKVGEISIEATKAVKYDIASVDLIEFEEKIYILDVNRTPVFSALQKVSNVNFAKEVIDFCKSKFDKEAGN